MQPYDEIKSYSKTVCEQIRWKKAHHVIAEEIENHLYDQRDAYISQGSDQNTATRKAILGMGDAVSIGAGLDKIHKPKPQWTMIALTAALMLAGLFSNYLIGFPDNASGGFILAAYIAALTVFGGCYFLDFSILGKYAGHFYLGALAVSLIGFLFSRQVNGGDFFFPGRFSASLSYLSLIFPLAYSLLVYALRQKGLRGLILSGLGYIPPALVLLLIPSFTGFALFTVLALVILATAILKGWFGIDKRRGLVLALMPAVFAFMITVFYALNNHYVLPRLYAAINPYGDPKGYGYIQCLVRDLLASSRFWGKGAVPPQFGHYLPAVPAPSTDYILVALTLYFGWIIFIVIAAVFLVFALVGLYYVSKQKSILGTMVSLPIIATFIMQAAIYMINNLGFGIFSSLSLPLVSYGKAALIVNSALIGFLLSVFRTGDIVRDNIKFPARNKAIFSYEDGKFIINLRG
jgi:cell division protein FtsW (lipid II flippase)